MEVEPPMTRGRRPFLAASPLLLALAAAPAALSQTPAADRPTLELSLDECVQRALENNVDIAVERFNPLSSEEAVREIQGLYDPLLTSLLSRRSATTPSSSFLSGGAKVETDAWNYNLGLGQNLRSGGALQFDFTNDRTETNNAFQTFNPTFNSRFNLSYRQPLLRNFRIDTNRQQLRVARRNREISDVQFRQTVINTLASVKQLYYDLIFAIDNLEAQRKSLALAKKLLEENQIKVRVGTMAPLDVVAAESEVATREEGVITAEAAVADAEDAIKRSIFAQNDLEGWRTRIVPRDRPTAEPMAVEMTAAITTALEKRTDLQAARKSVENAENARQFARNQVLPALDVTGAYGSQGRGGTQVRDEQNQPLVPPIGGGYGDALSDAVGLDFPTWSLALNLSYPIRNRTAKASEARAQVALDQARASLRRLELQVTSEVRTAARAVDTNFKRVESTRAARVLQERRLDAEEKRFAAGMSTNFLVTQAQRDLALAEVAELRAVADYRKSLVAFERVQEAGGGVSFATSSTTTANRTTR
jgi:outer membrane protein TolC